MDWLSKKANLSKGEVLGIVGVMAGAMLLAHWRDIQRAFERGVDVGVFSAAAMNMQPQLEQPPQDFEQDATAEV